MIRRAAGIACALVFVYSSTCCAASYFVAPNGSNSNDGRTSQTALASLQYALPLLYAGDTLFVRGGNYADTQYLVSVRSGSASHPIVIMAYPGERPVFTGPFNSSPKNRFNISNSYITIDGLTSIRGYSSGENDVMVVTGSGTSNITVKNCTLKGCPSSWIQTTTNIWDVVRVENSSYVTIDACSIMYAGKALSEYASDPYSAQVESNCILLYGQAHHIAITNSYVAFGAHDEIEADAGTNHLIIRNNVIDGSGTDDDATAWGGGYGVYFGGSSSAADSAMMYAVVENNRFRGQGARTYYEKCPVLIMGGSGITIRKNLLWNSYNHGIMLQTDWHSYYKYQYVNHNFIYNNSVINCGKAGVLIVANTPSCNPNRDIYDNTFANNLFYNAHQHQCWPDGEHCGWSSIEYLIGVATYTASPNYWYNNPSWGKNTFKNNLLSQFDPNTNGLNAVLWTTTDDYVQYSNNQIQLALPGVFTNNLFQVDPLFGQFGFAGVTLLPTSPCIDAGINMNAKDAVVQHLLTTDDVAWARANGLDTLVWYGRAPDIGAYERNPGSR